MMADYQRVDDLDPTLETNRLLLTRDQGRYL